MNKIKEIGASWITSINPTEEQKELACDRMKACILCNFRKDSVIGDLCSVCHCPLKAKIFSPENSCPKGKWEK